MTTPLVPPTIDLTDFDWMPFDFRRLFNSDTWALSSDAERVAAVTLWGKSWYQKPAGSLPSDDRILASANFTGTTTRWKRVKEMALRNWILCDDGRYYHPIVCERALEAWLEKLTSRISSGAGNASRWGGQFDPSAIEAEVVLARQFLTALNPHSRALAKRRRSAVPPGVPKGSQPGIPPGQENDPGGSAEGIPPGFPTGSQQTRTGTRTETLNPALVGNSTQDMGTEGIGGAVPPAIEPSIEQLAAASVAMRREGIGDAYPSFQPLREFIAGGGTVDSLAAVAKRAVELGKPRMSYVVSTAHHKLRDAKQAIQQQLGIERSNQQVAAAWASQGAEAEEVSYAAQ